MGHFDLVRSVPFVTTSTGVVVVPPAAKTMAVQFPTLDAGALSIEASINGEDYAPLNGKSGSDDTAYSWAASTGGFVISIVPVMGLHSVRFTSAVDQSTSAPITVRFIQDKTVV